MIKMKSLRRKVAKSEIGPPKTAEISKQVKTRRAVISKSLLSYRNVKVTTAVVRK